MPLRRSAGFTLIELMIVVVIIGILSAVALPSYKEYVRKGRRADAQQHLMALAQANQQHFLDTRAYTATASDLMATPSTVATYYTLGITVSDGPPPGFSIRAVPQGDQAGDGCGTLTITQSGARSSSAGTNCW